MDVKYKLDNDILYVMLSGELDEYSASYIREHLDNTFESNKFSSVVFEMSALDFMDSTGIGVLIGRYKIAKKLGISFYVQNLSKTVDKLFYMSGLYEIMTKLEREDEI